VDTHKFIARSAQEAVAKIRSTLGPNAVVLDVKRVPRRGLARLFASPRFEVTASVEEPAPAADPIAELRAELRRLQESVALAAPSQSYLAPMLAQSGLLPSHAEPIAARIRAEAPEASLQEQLDLAREILRGHWREPEPDLARCHIFVGSPGAGKSTVLCKWMAQKILGENVGATVLQLETHTANLSPQPKFYSEILGAQFTRSASRAAGSDLLFVDLPGIECGDKKALEQAQAAIGQFPGAAVHLVLNAAYDASLLLEQARFFAALQPAGLVATHLDEERRWGKLWNLVCGTKFCLRFLSAGQNVPGGLSAATAEALLRQQFGGNARI
jgi:flagellar biosynthesis protein FlhF